MATSFWKLVTQMSQRAEVQMSSRSMLQESQRNQKKKEVDEDNLEDEDMTPEEKQYVERHRIHRPMDNMCKETPCRNDNDCFGTKHRQSCRCTMTSDERFCWYCRCSRGHRGCL